MINFNLVQVLCVLCATLIVSCVLLFIAYQISEFAKRKRQQKRKQRQQQEFMATVAKEEDEMRQYVRTASLRDLREKSVILQSILKSGGSLRDARLKRIVDDEINNRTKKGGI